MLDSLIIRQLGLQPFERVSLAMRYFTDVRNTISIDEIWLVQHPQVFTQGNTGKYQHFLKPSKIPIVHSDRGGQLTFHGPGQQVMYVLFDLRRRQFGIRSLVTLLEQIVIDTLSKFGINACSYPNQPGVYVGIDKICSIGLRIRKGCSYHGLALNVNMDLTPFLCINPCGYSGLCMTQISNYFPHIDIDEVASILLIQCLQRLHATAGGIQSWDAAQYGV